MLERLHTSPTPCPANIFSFLMMDRSHSTLPLSGATEAAEKRDQNLEQTNLIAVQRQETEEELSIAALLTPICPANNWFCQPCGTQTYQCIHCGTNYCTYSCLLSDLENHRENSMCNILRRLKIQNRRRKRRENNKAFMLQHEMDLMWHEEVRKFQDAVMKL